MARAGFGMRMALAGLALALIGACAPVERNHGYVPSDDDLSRIAVGRDTRATVAEAVGRPTAGGVMEDSGWYYVQSRFRHLGAAAPREIDRQVVAISFDPAGRVANIERFGLEEGRVVPISRRVTETSIRGIGIVRQLMANLGNFDATRFLNRR